MPRLKPFNARQSQMKTILRRIMSSRDVLLIHLGDTAQAIQVLQKAVAIDADHARARTLLGIAYFRDNRH